MSVDAKLDALLKALNDLTTTVQSHTNALLSLKSGTAPAPAATTAAPAGDAAPAAEGTRTRRRRTNAEIAADEAAAKAKVAESEAAAAGSTGRKGDNPTEAEIREEAGDFLNFGDENSKDDQKERDKREAFIIAICDHFDVEGVKDIEPSDRIKVLNWIDRFQRGEVQINFATDEGQAAKDEPAPAAKERRRLV